MKRKEKIWIIVMGGLFVFAAAWVLAIKLFQVKVSDLMRVILAIDCIVVILGLMGPCIWKVSAWVKKGIHNIGSCDDEVFDYIDKFKYMWKEIERTNIELIQMINWHYKENGIVDQIAANNEIHRLYKRKDFLLKSSNFFEEAIKLFCSVVLSILTSFLLNAINAQFSASCFILIIVVVGIIAVFVLRYAERGQMGSYIFLVEEYELSLLSQKIEAYEKSLQLTDEDAKVLRGKQKVIEMLLEKHKKVKRKEISRLENDLITLEELNLCLGDYSDCDLKEIDLNEGKIYLVYDKGKETIGYENLKNDNYAVFLSILVRNEII